MQVLPIALHLSRNPMGHIFQKFSKEKKSISCLAGSQERWLISASEISHRVIYFSPFGKISLLLVKHPCRVTQLLIDALE